MKTDTNAATDTKAPATTAPLLPGATLGGAVSAVFLAVFALQTASVFA